MKKRTMKAIGRKEYKSIADATPETRGKQKGFTSWIATLTTCLILVLCIGVAIPMVGCNKAEAEAGTVTMEINPGVEYTVTKSGSVKSVRFLNDDAKDALEKIDFKGQSLQTAVTLTIVAYKTVGYMERNDTVLISFDKKLSENAKLKETVSENIRMALAKTQAVRSLVYSSLTDDAETVAFAERHNISQGKAKLVVDAAKNRELSLEELVELPLEELVDLQKEVDSIVLDTKYIGIITAKKIALKDAGCVTRVEFTEARLIDGGVKYPYYRLVFNDKHTQWTYLINAINGDILEKNVVARFISLEEAKIIALKDARVTGEKVVFTKEELSRNQGRPCWVLEFYTAKFEYSYKIDAKTGEIIFFDYRIDVRKAKEIALKDAGVYEDYSKITFTVEEYVGGGIKTPYYYFVFNNETTQWTYRIDATLGIVLDKSQTTLLISLQKAREIALKDAEITDPDEVTFTKEELNRSTDRPCWVLEFYTVKNQYVYKIDAETGEIIFNSCYICMHKAKEIALKDAGITETDKIVFTVEKLVAGGIKTPYYLFEFNDFQTQWTYRIDATRGDVMHREKTIMMISLEKAKEIALKDAEITEVDEVVFTVEVLSRNKGRPCWVLKFHTEKYQYSYKIDVKTGEIIESNRYIYIERARETALENAGQDGGGKIVFTVEELIDVGDRVPYYHFVFNNDTVRWIYHIDAKTGDILFKDGELM